MAPGTRRGTEKDGSDWWFLPRPLSNLVGWGAWELIPLHWGPQRPNPAKAREQPAPTVMSSEPQAWGHSRVNELVITAGWTQIAPADTRSTQRPVLKRMDSESPKNVLTLCVLPPRPLTSQTQICSCFGGKCPLVLVLKAGPNTIFTKQINDAKVIRVIEKFSFIKRFTTWRKPSRCP